MEEFFKKIFISYFICRFTEILQNIRKRHSTVIETLAQVMDRIFFDPMLILFSRVIWNFLIWVQLKNMKNLKYSIFLIDSTYPESQFGYLSINIVCI
jgi:hypothetical protein